MKKNLFLLALLIVPFFASAQTEKLPEKLYGEWYNKNGRGEYNGMLIRPGFIEYAYQACPYADIEKAGSQYILKALMPRGNAITFKITFLTDDSIKVVKPGGEAVVYGRVDCPLNGKRIKPEDIPEILKKVWYTTDGKNSVEFDFSNDKLVFRGNAYTIDDVVLLEEFWGKQYRITGKDKDGKPMMFYFKNWNDGYVQVGFYGKAGDYYKNNPGYPNVKCDDPQLITDSFKGKWYTTNGNDKVRFEFINGNIKVNGKYYKLQGLKKNANDRYILLLTKDGNVLMSYYIQKETGDYILFSKGYSSRPELLKHSISDKNYLTYKLPEALTGTWYSTEGDNKPCVTLSADEVVLCGKKTKNPVFGMTPNGIAIMTKSEKFVALVTAKTSTHIEIKSKKGETAIFKRTPETDNTMHIAPSDLPETVKGDWFGTDGSEYWAFGVTDKQFVADNAFWNYMDISYKDNTYTIVVENDNGVNTYAFRPVDNNICEISKNKGDFKVYTKDRGKAVYKPQNKFGSRNTKDVFIQGYVENMDSETPRTINFSVDNLVFDDQVIYPVKIDSNGRFAITFPQIYGQSIFIKNKGIIGMFVSPGDSILVKYDVTETDNSLFMGDDADACFDMAEYLRSLREKPRKEWEEQKYHVDNDTFFVYKEYLKKKNESDLKEFNEYRTSNPLSQNFIEWQEQNIKYNYPNDLMRYRWLHPGLRDNRGNTKIPESYFSFIKDYQVDLDSKIISSEFKEYCHELVMYYEQKKSTDPDFKTVITIKDIFNYLKDSGVEMPEDIAGYADEFLKGELDRVKDKSKISALNKFLQQQRILQLFYEEKFFNGSKEYYKQTDLPDVYQLYLTSKLYRVLENSDTTTIKKKMPVYLAEIENPDFKMLLNQKYEKQMAAARKPFVIKDAILTRDNPSSGDSLLVKIVNKHKGKVIYVDFWATWCGPCRGEMPSSLKIQEKMKGKDVAFVYLCSDSSPEGKWKQFINEMKLTGDHYYVNRPAWNDLTGRFGISGIPHYILIDKEGRVVQDDAKRPSQGNALISDIEELLEK